MKVRQLLIGYFRRLKCQDCESLADKTIERLASILGKFRDKLPTNPLRFSIGVARLIYKEHLRNDVRRNADLPDDLDERVNQNPSNDDAEILDRCLARCLQEIDANKRDLFTRYYSADGKDSQAIRDVIAAELGISITALRLRVMRIKDELRACITKCRQAGVAV